MTKWILSYDHHMMHPLVDDMEERMYEEILAHGVDEYKVRVGTWNNVAWRNLEDVGRPVIRGIKETMAWASE